MWWQALLKPLLTAIFTFINPPFHHPCYHHPFLTSWADAQPVFLAPCAKLPLGARRCSLPSSKDPFLLSFEGRRCLTAFSFFYSQLLLYMCVQSKPNLSRTQLPHQSEVITPLRG